MNYELNSTDQYAKKISISEAARKLWPLMSEKKGYLTIAFFAIVLSAGMNLLGPVIIGKTVDNDLVTGNFHQVVLNALFLASMYVIAAIASYVQTRVMGIIGQAVLFRLRNAVFTKLQELPVAFFNQNKAGDLISRINSDTDKLNQFFSQALMQFVGNFFLILGAAIFLVAIKPKLGVMVLLPAVGIAIATQLLSPWVKRRNTTSLQTTGSMSAEIQESIQNFKAVVAFGRRDYFRRRFSEANETNYNASVKAGVANNTFTPIYTLAGNIAQLIVVAYGIVLVLRGDFTLGLLIGFLLYVNNVYNPLRQLASIWSTMQLALAAFDRISEILELENNLPVIASESSENDQAALLEFRNVSFAYSEDKKVLHNIHFSLQPGKTYALVGPTGGGKTTTASLMARLFDPTEGMVLLNGKDIRSFEPDERVKKIGFILQEPFLFSGSVRDNIVYGNPEYANMSSAELQTVLEQDGLASLLERFSEGLDTKVASSGDSISLGQKQLIAFMRAALRHPELLILDEATANIDTVTEQLLQEILEKLPKSTTRVIIAHRLNTIENADEIFFINGGEVTVAGTLEHAVDMLMHGKRES
jgi:ATP-binding cassette subfamily B protein